LFWGRALGPSGGLSTGQIMLPAPHGSKEGRKEGGQLSTQSLSWHGTFLSCQEPTGRTTPCPEKRCH